MITRWDLIWGRIYWWFWKRLVDPVFGHKWVEGRYPTHHCIRCGAKARHVRQFSVMVYAIRCVVEITHVTPSGHVGKGLCNHCHAEHWIDMNRLREGKGSWKVVQRV